MVGGPLLLACCRHVSCDRQAGSAAPPTPTLCTAQQEWPLTACHTHTEMEVSSVHKQQCSGGWEGPGSALVAGQAVVLVAGRGQTVALVAGRGQAVLCWLGGARQCSGGWPGSALVAGRGQAVLQWLGGAVALVGGRGQAVAGRGGAGSALVAGRG